MGDDVKTLLATIDALNERIDDFRCEYEGTSYALEEAIKRELKLGGDGLYNTFSGVFIWKKPGDTHVSSFHRHEPKGTVMREELVVQAEAGKSEQLIKPDEASVGQATIDDALFVNSDRTGSYGQLYMLDTIKRFAAMEGVEASIKTEVFDKRTLTVLTFSFRGTTQPFQRFWLDLSRGGHAVRRESFIAGELVGRIDVKLEAFKVGNDQVWMPKSGILEGHSSTKDGKPYFPASPTSSETLYVVDGTMEFNKRPGPSAFKIDYKPGMLISDNLRRLQEEYGRQAIGAKPKKAEVEVMLREQLDRAEKQRSELVAGSPERDGPGWTSSLVWIFGTTTLVLAIALLIRRNRR